MEDKEYCTYVHKTKDGVVFYVGGGRETRANKKETSERKYPASGRGIAYSSFVKSLDFQYDAEIIESGLTKNQAIKLEQNIYDNLVCQGTLTNSKRPTNVRIFEADYLKSFVYYTEKSHTFLAFIEKKRGRVKENDFGVIPAGTISVDGYYSFKIDGVPILNHRAIAILHGFSIDGKVVDHIDGNRSNNSIGNIRVVTQSENTRNRVINTENSTGEYSVYFNKQKNSIFCGWYFNDKQYTKHFSLSKYSYETAIALAKEFRKNKLTELESYGIKYTERHSKS